MPINEAVVTDWRRRHRAPGLVELAVCRRLRELAAQVPADQAIVELGAYKGRATGWLLLGAQDGHGAHVTTIDPWTLHTAKPRKDYPLGAKYGNPAVYAAFKAHMDHIGATSKELTVKRGYAASCGAKWAGPPVGLLWHDAGHTADAVEQDLAAWAPHVAPGGIVVLHDAANPNRPDYDVIAGAARVLDAPGWDWAGRVLTRWKKRPNNRGALYVRRVSDDGGDGDNPVLEESGDDPPDG